MTASDADMKLVEACQSVEGCMEAMEAMLPHAVVGSALIHLRKAYWANRNALTDKQVSKFDEMVDEIERIRGLVEAGKIMRNEACDRADRLTEENQRLRGLVVEAHVLMCQEEGGRWSCTCDERWRPHRRDQTHAAHVAEILDGTL